MNKTQLSLTTLLLAGLFATGCSQQQIQEPVVEPIPAPQPVAEPVPEPLPAPTPPPVVIIKTAPPAPVVTRPKPRPRPRPVNPNCHHHASNAMTKSIQHCHKNPQGKHSYGRKVIRRHVPAPVTHRAVRPATKPQVNIRALQRKLKAKGYYKGAIDGVVGNGTRDALKRFQNR